MKIAGFVKNSFVDYPSTLCCVVFFSGCNMNCYYCHNSEIAHSNTQKFTEQEIIDEINMRKDFVDGVVISGGEPTLNENLPEFIKKIKKLGLKVKLDTNGTNPKMLCKLIDDKLVDYVAMDLKAPLHRYSEIAGKNYDISDIEKSIELLKQDKVNYEFRTTLCDKLTLDDILQLKPYVADCQNYYLQRCNGQNDDFAKNTQKLVDSQNLLKDCCANIKIRNL